MNKVIRLVACDLDETLLCMDRTITERNKAAIRELRKRGIHFVPCSGRGYASIDVTLKELGLYDEQDEYVISFNGGAITENRGHRLMYFQGISYEMADALYQRGLQYDVCIHVYTKEDVYVYNLVKDEEEFLHNRMEVKVIDEKDLSFLKGQDIVKVLYMNTDFSYLKKIEREVSDLTEDADVSFSSNRYIEFNKKGVTKGDGLRRLAELLGIDMKDTAGIGDNFNDLTLIQDAGIGACVANAVEDLKPYCDVVAEHTNDESGVAEIIEKCVLTGD